jgi:hypothetical protein
MKIGKESVTDDSDDNKEFQDRTIPKRQ